MKQVRYRTEAFSGTGERDAAEVMAYETFELGNDDILETLVSGVFSSRSHAMRERCLQMLDEFNKNGFADGMGFDDFVTFFRDVLSEIERSTGVRVKYALWLADIQTVTDRDWYGRDMVDDLSFDSYEIGPVVLSELGSDGTLYGYPELPVSLEAQIEDLQDELDNIINERENDNLDHKRALWLDEKYGEIDNRMQEINAVLQNKEVFVKSKGRQAVKEEVLEYDRCLAARCLSSDIAEQVDIMSPQECSNLFGKAVRSGKDIFFPSGSLDYKIRTASLQADCGFVPALAKGVKEVDTER